MKPRKGRTNFDPKSYEENDPRGKEAARKMFEARGHPVEINPDDGASIDYKCPDLIVDINGSKVFVEAQISLSWDSSQTPDGRPSNWFGFLCWDRKISQQCYPAIYGEKNSRGGWLTESNDLKYGVWCPYDAPTIKRRVQKNPRFGKEANCNEFELQHVLDLKSCLFVNLETGETEKFYKDSRNHL